MLGADRQHFQRYYQLEIAEKVLSSVEKTLRSAPFNFQGARIISGQEEGAYGWITINYLLGNFKQVLYHWQV